MDPDRDGTGWIAWAAKHNPVLLLFFVVVPIAAVSAWFAVVPSSASVNVDDGVYVVQGLALRGGDLSVPHLLADVDPDGRSHPYVHTMGGSVTGDGYYVQPRHALWSSVVGEFRSTFGVVGMRFPSALGLAVAVAATYYMAKLAGPPRSAPLAGALALTSPMLFNALQLWAHTAIAGAIAVALLGALWILRDGPALGPTVFVVGGCVVASMLRGDGLIFAVAIGMAFLLHALVARSLPSALYGSGVLLVSAAAYGATTWSIAERIDSSTLVSGSTLVSESTQPRSAPALEPLLQGAQSTLFTNLRYGGRISASLLLLAALLVLGAALSLRRDRLRDATQLMLAAAGVLLVRIGVLADADLPATGLLGGWPIALLVLALPIRSRPPLERFLMTVVALGIIGVVLSQGSTPGGLNWGGRYVSYSIPAIAVLIASALGRVGAADRRARASVLIGVGAVVLMSMVGMLKLDRDTRVRNDAALAHVDRLHSTLPIVTSHRYLPLLDWAGYPERQWLRVPPADDGGAALLASMLREAGIRRVVAYQVDPKSLAKLAPAAADSDVDTFLEPAVIDVSAG